MTKTFDEIVKEHNDFQVSQLQRQLETAFYWMAKATQESREGNFRSATSSMMLATKSFIDAQHQSDLYLSDEDDIDYANIVELALAQARIDMYKESKDNNED